MTPDPKCAISGKRYLAWKQICFITWSFGRSPTIYFGAVGAPDVPDHITLWGLRLAICQPLDQYANVRPTRDKRREPANPVNSPVANVGRIRRLFRDDIYDRDPPCSSATPAANEQALLTYGSLLASLIGRSQTIETCMVSERV